MANSGVPAADEAGRELLVRLAFGSMAAQTLRAAVRRRVVEPMGDTPRRATEAAAAVPGAHRLSPVRCSTRRRAWPGRLGHPARRAAPYSLIEAVAG
ncbi:O-methyltransferase [Streptomyces sp. GBA 94-10 4N24]|nr:O-methyltransferase [Streptomyces sp. GBA 94-10 4N24]ESQ07450.1 O-methyltransferase [Streptomyces sp. PVA_94-07]UZN57682.1 O-methyltransferase [Streptomyces sp. GBA 94-10 4N24]